MSIPRAFARASVVLALMSVAFFRLRLRTISCNSAKQRDSNFGSLSSPPGETASATDPHSRRRLHRSQIPIAIETESSSGRLRRTRRCLFS